MHIDGGRLLEHRPGIREHLHLAAGVAQTLGSRREVGTVQRQQAFHDRLAGQRVLDLGVDDVDLVQFAGLEIIDGIHRDITGALQGGSRGTVMEILHQTVVQIIQSGTVAEMDLRNVYVTIASVEVSILRHFGREGALDVGDAVLQLKI